MDEIEVSKFEVRDKLNLEALPDDTLTVVIRSGGRVYSRGVNLPETQEQTAKVVKAVMQQTLDTVDAKGLKAGGSRFAPENQ